jgi:hypothetical protein
MSTRGEKVLIRWVPAVLGFKDVSDGCCCTA